MFTNRTTGVTLLAIGIAWFAAVPAFLWVMVSMEGSAGPDRPDVAVWRLWQALEILMVEPRWLAYSLSLFMLGAAGLGIALFPVGIALLGGNSPAPKWATAAVAAGVGYCGIGFVFHWALLMPAVSASDNPAVVRAAAELRLVVPMVLTVGLVSMVVAGLVLLGTGSHEGPAGFAGPAGRAPFWRNAPNPG
jgi:hypothetical protein